MATDDVFHHSGTELLPSSAVSSSLCLPRSSRFSLRSSLLSPRGRPFSPPSHPSGTEPLPSLLYPFSATNPVVYQLLLFKKPHWEISGGLLCHLFFHLCSIVRTTIQCTHHARTSSRATRITAAVAGTQGG